MSQAHILERLGLCHQVHFVRWASDRLTGRKRPPPIGLRIKDSTFAGVPVRIYEPTAVSQNSRRGLVYFHGGGWVVGSIGETHVACLFYCLFCLNDP